jgi:nitrogen fixation protein FixH
MRSTTSRPREVTGRTVLLWLVAFFGVVVTVNVVMARLAASTFGGVETEGAYKLGLAFNAELAAVRKQDNRHWVVAAHVERKGDDAVVKLAIADPAGNGIGGLDVDVRLVHPMDSRFDHSVTMTKAGLGQFRGEVAATPGQWDLVADFRRGEEHVFRSKSRIILR